MNTNTHTVQLPMLLVCIILPVALAANAYNLSGDPMLAGPQPPFKLQSQISPGLESEMDPRPDFGYSSYVGSGKLQGKVAVITGGDSGIGRAVALAFAREGASVVISYLNETEDAEEIQKVIQKEGHKCILIPGDITKEAYCKKIIDETVSRFKQIDILVNNAAYQGHSLSDSILGMSHERVLYTFQTNIIAMFDLTRYAIPHMPKGSSIINVASMQAYQPSPEVLDYAATKAAIVGFTKGLAVKMVENGIRVNCVAPGPVWTPIVVSSNSAEKTAQYGSNIPLKRPAQPRELAPAFVYLASSKDSSFVTGEVLGVTGGVILA
jgi:NAD(P)-dependent dehydrogenase (short-subunit alcohol dehydrogenase family)